MKLFYSPTSPYARKCRVVAREKDLIGEIQEIMTNPWGEDTAALCAANPLGKVPTLILNGGKTLFDSRVICGYLDSLTSEPRLIPAEGASRFDMLRLEALSDGLLDASVSLVLEARRPTEQQSPSMTARWRSAIDRALPVLAETVQTLPSSTPSLGGLTAAVALAYLDFRLPQIDWRTRHADLSAWYEGMKARPSFVETAPPTP